MIFRFIVFDAANLVTQVRRVILPIALVVLFAAAVLPAFAVVGAAVAVVLTASMTFSADERGRLDILYGTLPLTRWTVVVGRYAALVLLFLATAVVGNVATVIASAIRNMPVDFDEVALANIAGFAVVAVILGLQLPLYFAWGFTRVGWLRLLPLLVILLGIQIASWTGVSANVFDSSATIFAHLALAGVVALVGGVVILIASAVIAGRLYRRRQL